MSVEKKLAFKPFDKELRQRCFCLHRKYYKAQRAKRRNYFSNIMKQLESISSNNWKAFWDLINKLKDAGIDNSEGLIESSTWKDYFKNLNSIEPLKISLAKSFLEQFKSIRIPENCVFDQHFSLNEISAACQELKKRKVEVLMDC